MLDRLTTDRTGKDCYDYSYHTKRGAVGGRQALVRVPPATIQHNVANTANLPTKGLLLFPFNSRRLQSDRFRGNRTHPVSGGVSSVLFDTHINKPETSRLLAAPTFKTVIHHTKRRDVFYNTFSYRAKYSASCSSVPNRSVGI